MSLPLPAADAIIEDEDVVIEIPEGKHVLEVIDHTGDTKIIWDPENDDEVENAKRTFEDLKKKGFTPYSVKRTGAKNEILTKFDPDEAKVIMIPRMAGG